MRARLAKLDELGEDAVFRLYLEVGTVKAVTEQLFEPAVEGAKDWAGWSSTAGSERIRSAGIDSARSVGSGACRGRRGARGGQERDPQQRHCSAGEDRWS